VPFRVSFASDALHCVAWSAYFWSAHPMQDSNFRKSFLAKSLAANWLQNRDLISVKTLLAEIKAEVNKQRVGKRQRKARKSSAAG
jgi:hypothetical protein